MQHPGLSSRLNQHSRRAGIAVGLSMFATIALLIGAFIWFFVKVESFTSDFTGIAGEIALPTPPGGGAVAGASEDPPAKKKSAKATRTPRAKATATPEPTPTSDAFQVTHLSNPALRVNFRPQPGTNNAPVRVLDGATPLQFLNERQTGPDGAQWLKFRLQDGTEGWLREGTFVDA